MEEKKDHLKPRHYHLKNNYFIHLNVLVKKAFELAKNNIFLLDDLNDIYKFKEYTSLCRDEIDAFLKNGKAFENFKVISAFDLHDEFKIDLKKVIPLKISS